MSGPYSGPGNDPFQGGSLQRLNPPSGGTFGIPPPSGGGGGGSLAGNVAGGAPFFARNNRGSNVSIPYARVVSSARPKLQVSLPGNATALPKQLKSIDDFNDSTKRITIDVIRETDELKKARLAWIMGRRGSSSDFDQFVAGSGAFDYMGEGMRHIPYWDAGKGVNRSSRLCSTEYLMQLFQVTMMKVSIQLSLRYDHPEMGGKYTSYGTDGGRSDSSTIQATKKVGFFPNYAGGLLGTVSKPMKKEGTSSSKMLVTGRYWDATTGAYLNDVKPPGTPLQFYNVARGLNAASLPTAADDFKQARFPMQVPLQQSASMTLTNNITFDVSSRDMSYWFPAIPADPSTGQAYVPGFSSRTPAHDSKAARSVDNRQVNGGLLVHQSPDRDFKCGIYTRSLSPFLHGRTLLTGMSATLTENEKGYPRNMPDALGDHVAFAALEQAMTRVGLLDWRPDGVVNSKLENGPDEMADAAYDAKDGQLFNIHVQGPAICSNWCGTEHSRSLVAGDKLFVAIVADCWINCGDKGGVDTSGNAIAISNKYKHLPQEMQDFLNDKEFKTEARDAAMKMREELLSSFQKGVRSPNLSSELLLNKVACLTEMETERDVDGRKYDYHTNNTVNPHLLCNFRLKYVTSSQMVETSKLILDDKGGVAMGPNGKWLAGSRLGLAFSRTQTNNNTYDPELDLWLDHDNSIAEAIKDYAKLTGTGSLQAVREQESARQMKAALQLRRGKPHVTKRLEDAATEAMRAIAEDKRLKDEEALVTGTHAPTVMTAAAARVTASAAELAAAKAAFQTTDGIDKDAYALLLERFRGPPQGAALHEVVVGAWHVGTVLDTAASRGAGRGFASHQYDSAVNLNVDVQWWSGDRLFKNYANKPGTGKDFRLRCMPVMGGIYSHAFDVKTGVGIDGGDITKDHSIAKRHFDLLQATLANDGAALTADQAEATLAAITTFPDSWDLPAAVPMLPKENPPNVYYLPRTEYVGVGRQRGKWDGNLDGPSGTQVDAIEDGSIRVGRSIIPNFLGEAVTDPGHEFGEKPENIVAHSSRIL